MLFPADAPDQATGPGALVWPAGPSCPGGAGARIDPIGADDELLAPARPRTAGGAPIVPQGSLAATAGPYGQIVIAGADPRRPSQALLIQGGAGGPFAPLAKEAPTRPPGALGTAYLGDVALAAPATRAGGLVVAVERHYARVLGRAILAGGAGVRALTVALDFRSDVLVAWAQGDSIYAREIPASGVRGPLQRLGPAGSDARIASLISDDGRGIVMWSEQRGAVTELYLDHSAAGPRFGPPTLVESAQDPAGTPRPSDPPRLVRLLSEGVVAAWTGVLAGRWVVRTAPIDQNGLRTVGTIAAPGGGEAVLRALAAGPRGEAIMLLSEEPAAGAGPAGQVLLGARGADVAPGRSVFEAPRQIAPAGPLAAATVAVDPGSDRAVAAWESPGGAIFYAVGSPLPAG